jgi:TolB-like protein
LCTPRSASSNNCIDEVSYALDNKIPFLGVYFAETQLPSGMEMRLNRHQAILKYELDELRYREKLSNGLSKLLKLEPVLIDENIEVVVPSKGKPALARWKKVAAGLVLIVIVFGGLFSIDQSRLWLIEMGVTAAIKVAGTISPVELEQELGIAVLPFVNMSNDPDNEYFSDGISEQILNALVKANRMNVIARTSSFSFKDKNQNVNAIGRSLGVTHILEGSVRKANNNVRITAQLIDATTGAHLWSETYDRELLDIFAIQDEIAAIVTDQIDQTLGIVSSTELPQLATRGTESTVAFDLLLQARHFANIDNPYEMQKAIPLY